MPQKCESISYCNPTPYRDPRKQTCNLQPAWRFTTMHLKPYPKLQEQELHRESALNGTRGIRVDQQRALRTEWGVRQACTHVSLSSNGTANRCPLGVISTNTLRCTTNSNNHNGGAPTSRVNGDFPGPRARKNKTASSVTTLTGSLVLLASSTGMENEGSLRLYQGEDGEGPLDIWAVIKPGNTKEKIAIFAQQSGHASGGGTDSTPDSEGPAQDLRTISMKVKGCWDGECSVAKRRRKSGNLDKPRGLDLQAPKPESRPTPVGSENTEPSRDEAEEMVYRVEAEEVGKPPSVVEMVAYLEQMASDQRVDSKPLSLRSSSTITLSKGGSALQPVEQQEPKSLEQPENREEEGECVRVQDMVAKLESECLKRQSFREGGVLSRNNSLRRNVGRVLLASSEPYSAPSKPTPPSGTQELVSSSTEQLPCRSDKPCGASDAAIPVPTVNSDCGLTSQTGSQDEVNQVVGQEEACAAVEAGHGLQSESEQDGQEASQHIEEPPPGMLFFSQSPPLTLQERPRERSLKSRDVEPMLDIQDCKPSLAASLKPPLEPCSTSEGSVDKMGDAEEEVKGDGDEAKSAEGSNLVCRQPVPLRPPVSSEFLEMRNKIQLLLEPQQYMACLPHHIIVKIFCLLPTESLAALKCTCHYFKFIIESYGVRPADSRWVSDPRYKDDPCKQCKKRYGRGDVSLCRWHHKPYCQALPYGPGYWMCCRGSHKDTPGCNVGLHDNRWVPAFHSINMPIYKKNKDNEEDS
ncbi:F-box only protein 34 [Chanos chanos]|uniref:F-box only protein 34 n=1 Tax=Chanos chanos TaxID=29144 RepID=A0A6J2VX98_CHACN|nr:F-box only protein 34 [Chanos chanos]XP_030637688.1 F-box only protein 34 [Chanos chanos]